MRAVEGVKWSGGGKASYVARKKGRGGYPGRTQV